MVSSSWERSPPRSERSAYRRKPKLGAAVGVGREPGGAALGISTLLTRVAETASRMTIRWEMKREEKDQTPTLAIEVRILVLETQSFALDQRVGQRPIKGSSSTSPVGGKSAGISIRSSLFQQVKRQMSCGFVQDYSTIARIVKLEVGERYEFGTCQNCSPGALWANVVALQSLLRWKRRLKSSLRVPNAIRSLQNLGCDSPATPHPGFTTNSASPLRGFPNASSTAWTISPLCTIAVTLSMSSYVTRSCSTNGTARRMTE
jgi:hypothetical protein